MRHLLPTTMTVMLTAAGLASPSAANEPAASQPSPQGLWATFDDRSGERRSLVQINVENGTLRGTVTHVYLRPAESPDPVCGRCNGARRNARVVGMLILWGHRAHGSRWDNGRILDPENGKEYASSLRLEDDETLRVRGHWGPFHRTQTWRRVHEAPPLSPIRKR